MNTDWDYIASLEKAIKDKFGEQATLNPNSEWNTEKEEKYIVESQQQIKNDQIKSKKQQEVEKDGILIKKKLVTTKTPRECRVFGCGQYSFSQKDDVYMSKFECCYKCYIKYVEGRESLWQERKKVIFDASFKT